MSRYDIYLSYSGRKTYLTCPKQYYFRYVIKDPSRGDTTKSMFGTAIGKIFEWFYNDKIWMDPNHGSILMSRVGEALESTYISNNYVIGTNPSIEVSIKNDMREFIPKGIEIIKNNGFLTPFSKAEVDLSVVYRSEKTLSISMGGRADFIHGKNSNDVWILDGKASKHREKYVDSDQLIWYATQYYLKYHVAPTRLGFIFWCFPDKAISWIEYNSDSMRSLIKKTLEVSQRILDKDFSPTPSGDCTRCPFLNKCEDGHKHLVKKRVESLGKIDDSFFDIERV